MPALFDLDARFRAMDTAGDGYAQILSAANPPVENIGAPADALALSRIANDEMAELVSRHPARFLTAAACIPMNDVDAAVDELDRAVGQLGFRGVQIYTDCRGVPLDCSIRFEGPSVRTTRPRTRAASIRGARSDGCTTPSPPWRA